MEKITNKFALIGVFVYKFEFIVSNYRRGCTYMVQTDSSTQKRLIKAIFGQRLWSAEPLVATFESMANEALHTLNDPDAKTLLKDLELFSSRFKKLIEFRNQLLHGTHIYGDSDHAMLVIKDHQSKKGYSNKTIIENETDFYTKLEELEELASQVITLTGRIVMKVRELDWE